MPRESLSSANLLSLITVIMRGQRGGTRALRQMTRSAATDEALRINILTAAIIIMITATATTSIIISDYYNFLHFNLYFVFQKHVFAGFLYFKCSVWDK